jgi:hypothetical protein
MEAKEDKVGQSLTTKLLETIAEISEPPDNYCICETCGAKTALPQMIGPNGYWLQCKIDVRSCPSCSKDGMLNIESTLVLYMPLDFLEITFDTPEEQHD